MSMLCVDIVVLWGGENVLFAGCWEKLDVGVVKVGVGFYDCAMVIGNGIVLQCLYWLLALVALLKVVVDFLDVLVLLLLGMKDFLTLLEWVKAECAHVPCGRFVVVFGAGYFVQL